MVSSAASGQDAKPAGAYEDAVSCYVTFSGLYGVASVEVAAGTGRLTAADQLRFVSAANRLDPIILRLGKELNKTQPEMATDLKNKHAADSIEPKRLLEEGRFNEAMEILLGRVRACDSKAFN